MSKFYATSVAFIAGAAVMMSIAACTPPEPTEPEPATQFPPITLIACPVEDSDNCYWDADAMGNGTGTDFVTIDGVTYYPKTP